MFKNTFQSGFLSILYSIGSKPLQIWDKKVRNGHIKRITDNDIQSLVLEIEGTNVSTTYITCPADPKKTLGIKLPFLVMIIKNLKKYFTFEVHVPLETMSFVAMGVIYSLSTVDQKGKQGCSGTVTASGDPVGWEQEGLLCGLVPEI